LSGFLGSGKTSFLQNCIEYHTANNRFVAVIQNEVGEVGLDGKLLEDDYAVLEMDEGCVCCSLIGQLQKGINQILANFHPDVIILETPGLANPYNLLADIAELEDRIRFDSVTVLVDASNFDQNIREYEVAREQIKAADILLLNKIDLISDPEIRAISRKLKEINPNVPILNTTNGQINPGLMYGTDARLEPRSFKQKTEGRQHSTHTHDHLSSICINIEHPLDRINFLESIKKIPESVYRIKGTVEFTDCEAPCIFQFVNGRYDISEFHRPENTERYLICIGQHLNENTVRQLLGSYSEYHEHSLENAL
jgi:G3E family GTPase